MLVSAVIVFLVLQEDFWWDFLKIHLQVPCYQSPYSSTTFSSIRSLDSGKCKNNLPLSLLGKLSLIPSCPWSFYSPKWFCSIDFIAYSQFYVSLFLSQIFWVLSSQFPFFSTVFSGGVNMYFIVWVWFLCCELSLGRIVIGRIYFMGKLVCLLSGDPNPRWHTK